MLVNGTFTDHNGTTPTHWNSSGAVICGNVLDSCISFDLNTSNMSTISQTVHLPIGTYTLSSSVGAGGVVDNTEWCPEPGVSVKLQVCWDSENDAEDGLYVYEKTFNGDDWMALNTKDGRLSFTFDISVEGDYSVNIVVTKLLPSACCALSIDDVILQNSTYMGELILTIQP